ncbi:putative protein kinase [Acorus calamus]|uniref:Protein kinase domain-containing protein n=1 Tax=Acorus calamus TaxID=4465 RepID=A0AAV9DMR2_ACOCL|nr:putative protein kinase [Acorus calamus]
MAIIESRGPNFARNGAPQKALHIEIPALTLAELNRLTGNFGQKALIGEGPYGRAFYATLSSGQAAAIKKLDPSSSQEPDSEFAAQLSVVSRLKHEHFVELLGYCMDSNNRILVYQFATMGSLHDMLHAKGLEYLHEKVQPPIAHHDVRSSNVFLFDGYTAKMSDFNLTNQSPDTAGSSAFNWSPRNFWLSCSRATPRLSEDKVHQCVDPKLNKQYPPKAVAKLAAMAALCVQYEADFRPNMTIVVKAIQLLLNSKPAGLESHM